MRFPILLCACLFACGPVSADFVPSVLFGRSLLKRGDSAEQAREVAGAPRRVERIDEDGGKPMEIWTYERGGREVTLWIVDGRVVQIDERTGTHDAS